MVSELKRNNQSFYPKVTKKIVNEFVDVVVALVCRSASDKLLP